MLAQHQGVELSISKNPHKTSGVIRCGLESEVSAGCPQAQYEDNDDDLD